ncbi:Glyco_hydro_35 domain-containing protein [Mucor velutinosus]|uniref:Glyco_hydro_35 domain-containing protein n=1 Tax=Mucor velutinosus TaxID=708070 RepID=A0AAN7HZW6_9FUNG|nr:Glyco_hydro_35 domain-containing protein [Mucor velutinosus]
MGRIEQPDLTWWNVGEASTAVLIAAIVSLCLGTKLELSLIISGMRCVVQLSLMGFILDDVLKTQHMSVVMAMSVVFVLLGSYETVFNRTKKTFKGMFPVMFGILLISNLFITYIGTAFVLKADPFWDPPTFVPVIGMLLGNSMSSVAMATERCLDQFSTHAPMLETRLSFGASRYEASLPLAVEAIRLALLPVITQLSVMGMINIPGMMTGQIMAGTPMMEAVIYQQCIMFMIAASSGFGVVMSVAACMSILIDKDQNMRHDRILSNKSFHQYFPFKRLRHAFLCNCKIVSCCCSKTRKPRKSISDEA